MRYFTFLLILTYSFYSRSFDVDSVYKRHYSKTTLDTNFLIGDKILLPAYRISFDSNSDTLNYRFYQQLADFLSRNIFIVCELIVHTDTRGSHEANLQLSLARSKFIADQFFHLFGSDTLFRERLIPRGVGESQPLFSDDEILQYESDQREFLHQINRRIELRIVSFLGNDFYRWSSEARRNDASSNIHQNDYKKNLLMADKALLEGYLNLALEYYFKAMNLAPAEDSYAKEQYYKIKVLLNN